MISRKAPTNIARDSSEQAVPAASSNCSPYIHAMPLSPICSPASIIAARPGSYDTDPQDTQSLWKLVASMPDNRPVSVRSRSRYDTTSQHRERGQVCLLGSPEFSRKVLQPRGIVISLDHFPQMSAFAFFKAPPPAAGVPPSQHYATIPTLRKTTIWLDSSSSAAAELADAYRTLRSEAPPLAEWTLAALTEIFKAEPRSRLPAIEQQPLLEDGDDSDAGRCWLPMRLAGEPFTPTDGLWAPPPLVAAPAGDHDAKFQSTTTATTAFPTAIAPTASYWLWAGGFWPAVTPYTLAGLTRCRYARAVCPYLSVQVEEAEDNESKARGREYLAAAGATALFNAWKMFTQDGRGRGNAKVLRHFGVLLAGVCWEVWVLEPVKKGEGWAGCRMGRVEGGEMHRMGAFDALFHWINEVQRWGNTKFARACVTAVKEIEERKRKECGVGEWPEGDTDSEE